MQAELVAPADLGDGIELVGAVDGAALGRLRQADRVVLASVYQQSRIPEDERLHPEEVVATLNAAGTPAELLADADAIVAGLTPQLAEGDVVAILSNGGFDGIYEKLPAQLRKRFSL